MDISSLSNEELRDELIKNGAKVGPIVATTRKVYEMKLAKLIGGPEEEDEDPMEGEEGSREMPTYGTGIPFGSLRPSQPFIEGRRQQDIMHQEQRPSEWFEAEGDGPKQRRPVTQLKQPQSIIQDDKKTSGISGWIKLVLFGLFGIFLIFLIKRLMDGPGLIEDIESDTL